MHIQTHIYSLTHTHSHIHKHIYTYIHIQTHTYSLTHTLMHIRTHMRTHTHTYTSAFFLLLSRSPTHPLTPSLEQCRVDMYAYPHKVTFKNTLYTIALYVLTNSSPCMFLRVSVVRFSEASLNLFNKLLDVNPRTVKT